MNFTGDRQFSKIGSHNYKDLIKFLVLHHGYILNVQLPKKVASSAPDLIYYNTSSTVQVFKEPVANYIPLSLNLTTLASDVDRILLPCKDIYIIIVNHE